MIVHFVTVLMLIASVVRTRTAQLECDNGCKVAGTNYNLTCTSTSSGNCDWFEGTTRVVACSASGNCVPDELGYSGVKISGSHYVLQIESLTAATFECQLGLDVPVSCTIAPEADVPTGTLTATCESDLITCSGITNHGTPAVEIELKKGSSVLTSTTMGGSVNITQANSAGITYTCAVTGNLANCLSPSSVDVTCPEGKCPLIILIVAVIFLLLVLISLLVTYFVKKEWFQYAAIGFGGWDAVVGIICTAVYFAVCQSATPLGTSAAAFSIILLVFGIIFIVIGVLYPYCSKKSSQPV